MSQSRTVFLVDDDWDDCEIFGFALETLGAPLSLVCAFDGVNALEQMAMPEFVRPDLIVLDLNMPRMNGMEFLAELRKRPEYAQTPVVVYSTSSAPADINGALHGGATAFMTKHSSFPRMCDDLRDVLARYHLLPATTA